MPSPSPQRVTPDGRLRLVPYVDGVRSGDRIILRHLDAPRYLSLTNAELDAVGELNETNPVVSEFLGRYLGGTHGLNFKQAVGLLMKLHQNGFLSGGDDLGAVWHSHVPQAKQEGGVYVGRVARLVRRMTGLFDCELLSFQIANVHPWIKAVGAFLSSTSGVAVTALFTVCLAVLAGLSAWPDRLLSDSDFIAPETLVVKLALLGSLAASWTALVSLIALVGTGPLSGAVDSFDGSFYAATGGR